MRILVIGINFWPELVGAGKYSGELTAWLAGRGHEVCVITAPPYYPQWRVAEGYSRCRYQFEHSVASSAPAAPALSIRIVRCPLWVPRRLTGLKRMLHLFSFAVSSVPAILMQLRWKPEVVLAMVPTFFCVPSALTVSCLSGARSWLHVQDFEVDAAFEMGILRSPRLRSGILRIEKWLLQRFDRVSTISPKMQGRLIEKGVPADKTLLLPNWVDTDAIAPFDGGRSFRVELGIPADKVVALYSGNMGEKQGLELVVEAARRLVGNHDIVFVLCGEGSARANLQRLADGMGNIFFLPLQPMERLNELLNFADIHLLPQRADVADLVMPSKLTGMLASGRPVVATAALGTQVALVVEQCGLVVPPGDVDAFANAVSRLADNAPGRAEMGAMARVYAEANLGRDVILSRFERELLSLIKT